jgi:hypothetical protein
MHGQFISWVNTVGVEHAISFRLDDICIWFVAFLFRPTLIQISCATNVTSVTKSFHGGLRCVHMKSINMA